MVNTKNNPYLSTTLKVYEVGIAKVPVFLERVNAS
jgi:hypothetical protein